MSLGLDTLTDDQLFNLCREMCAELSQRDPYIQRCAQTEITTAAERLQISRDALITAARAVRKQYEEDIHKEVLVEVESLVSKGQIKLMDAKQEAAVIKEADILARRQLLQKLKDTSNKGLMPRNLVMVLDGKKVTLRFGATEISGFSKMDAKQTQALIESIIDF